MLLANKFIKRWLKISHEEKADKLLNDYDNFADGMRWTLITNKLTKQYDIEVTEEEVRQMAYQKVAGYFGSYYDPKMLEPVVKRMMEDPESMNGLAGDVLADKLFFKMKENIGLHEISISEVDLKEKYDRVMKQEEARAKLTQGQHSSEEEE